MRLLHATIVAGLLVSGSAFAQTQTQDHQEHHPGAPAAQAQPAQPSTPTPAQPQQPGPGAGMMGGGGMMGGQGMMGPGMMQGGMMQGGMGMMGQGGPGMMQGGMMQGGMMQGMMGQGGPGMQGGMGMQGRGMANAAPIDRVEGRLAFLKTELKITDAQLALWNRFADAVRTNAQTRNAEMQAMHGRVGSDVSLPDRLLAQANAFTAHAEEMTKLKAALDPLYAVLNPEQKKVADEIVISPMGVPAGMM